MKTVFIYALKDPRDGAVRYIGKTDNPSRRARVHNRAKPGTYKDNWVVSLKNLNYLPEMEVLDSVPFDRQDFYERAYIRAYLEAGAKLTNLTEGGDGGKIICPETLAKMAAKRLGSRHSPETKRRMSESQLGEKNHRFGKPGTNLGVKFTPEQRANISAGRMGKGTGSHNFTEEGRRSLSASKTGRNNPQFGKTGALSPNFGKRLTDAQKLNLSIKQSAFQQKKKAAKNV